MLSSCTAAISGWVTRAAVLVFIIGPQSRAIIAITGSLIEVHASLWKLPCLRHLLLSDHLYDVCGTSYTRTRLCWGFFLRLDTPDTEKPWQAGVPTVTVFLLLLTIHRLKMSWLGKTSEEFESGRHWCCQLFYFWSNENIFKLPVNYPGSLSNWFNHRAAQFTPCLTVTGQNRVHLVRSGQNVWHLIYILISSKLLCGMLWQNEFSIMNPHPISSSRCWNSLEDKQLRVSGTCLQGMLISSDD